MWPCASLRNVTWVAARPAVGSDGTGSQAMTSRRPRPAFPDPELNCAALPKADSLFSADGRPSRSSLPNPAMPLFKLRQSPETWEQCDYPQSIAWSRLTLSSTRPLREQQRGSNPWWRRTHNARGSLMRRRERGAASNGGSETRPTHALFTTVLLAGVEGRPPTNTSAAQNKSAHAVPAAQPAITSVG